MKITQQGLDLANNPEYAQGLREMENSGTREWLEIAFVFTASVLYKQPIPNEKAAFQDAMRAFVYEHHEEIAQILNLAVPDLVAAAVVDGTEVH